MTIRLQQMHPALVHLPIALLPLAVGADLAGHVSDNPKLCDFGGKAIALAALGALAAAASGLIAGEEVNVEGESRDMLMTHRNLNFVATVVATSMAVFGASVTGGQTRSISALASRASVLSPTRPIWAASWSTTKASVSNPRRASFAATRLRFESGSSARSSRRRLPIFCMACST